MGEIGKKPYKIGLTGGIACGKSLVMKILDGLGVPSIDADEVVHDILRHDAVVIGQIKNLLGENAINEDGSVNRKAVAALAFKDYSLLKQLEDIIHPKTFQILTDFLGQKENEIVVVVIPLLFETNKQSLFDSVWLVTADKDQQIERIKLRDALTEDEALQRIESQMPQNLKIAMADVIIDNSGSIDALQAQIVDLINKKRTELQK